MNDKKIIDNFNLLLSKYIKSNKINHAYLIETNYNDKILLANKLINKILSYENNISIDDLMINGDLIIISNDSNVIKTEEIENIKERFKTTSVLNSKRIYVIDGAEKLNEYASNKLLKFLEEPESDIIAILLTENKRSVINTIVSRCFNIRFVVNENLISSYDSEYLYKLFDFVMNVEENKESAIAYQNRYNIKDLSDRVYLKDFLNNMLLVYDDVINFKITNKVEYFKNYIEKIEKICQDNDIENIRIKINAINTCIDRLKYNPNVKLLIDKLIILMSGVDLNV